MNSRESGTLEGHAAPATNRACSAALDDVVAAARAALESRLGDTAERVARIKVVADAYLAAVAHDLAAEFASRNGLDARPAGSSTVRAALDLRMLVNALPEVSLAESPGTPSGGIDRAPRSTPPALGANGGSEVRPTRRSRPDSFAHSLVDDPRELRDQRAPRTMRPEAPLSPPVDELMRDLRAANLDEVPAELLRAYVEEFAARARYLQDTFPSAGNDAEALSRAIRTLTAIVSKRGLTGIYGLSRTHSADWQVRARDAARRRQQMLSTPPRAPDDGELGADAVGAPETPPLPPPRDDDEGDDDLAGAPGDAHAPLPLDHLAHATSAGPVVIVGGIAKPEKLERLRRRAGLALEWLAVDAHGGGPAVASLAHRIRDGHVAALVVLQDLVAHKHTEPLLHAARGVGLGWTYGGRGGTATLERALLELESILAQRAARRPARGSP